MRAANSGRTMRRAMVSWVVSLSCLLFAAASADAEGTDMRKALLYDTSFSEAHCAWQPYGARDEIRPGCTVDVSVSRTGRDGSLRIACSQATQYGGWTQAVDQVKPGAWYRLDAYYRADQVQEERQAVVARLDWRSAADERVGEPDYVYYVEGAGGRWKHVWALAPAPEGAAKLRLELSFGWRPGGTVWWDEISLGEADPPAPRKVRVATIHHRPEGSKSAQANIEEFCGWVERAARQSPDIVCLPEGMTMVGTGLTYEQVAEPIPGPTSQRLGELARKHHCYLAACYNERDGVGVYNTAILIDREGKLVGKYRKTYVPREEIEGGVTPGDACAVFETDFGKVGMMICWDVQYVEPAQRMALKGAEVIVLPIWGGNETLMKARAIENHVFLVSCGYDAPSWVIAPDGKLLAEASGEGENAIAVVEIDLSERYLEPWLGDMRARFFKEHREDLR